MNAASLRLAAIAAVAAIAAGCGGSPTSGPAVTVQPALTYSLASLDAFPCRRGRQADAVSFKITQPNGTPLTKFKRGPGPHTGVHLIIVRRDLATIIHRHPPIAADGTISETVTFTKPGPYRVVVDVVPEHDRAAARTSSCSGNAARRGDVPPAAAAAVRARPTWSTATGSRFTAARTCTPSRPDV